MSGNPPHHVPLARISSGHYAKITRLRLTEMRIISENSVLMLQQLAELAVLGVLSLLSQLKPVATDPWEQPTVEITCITERHDSSGLRGPSVLSHLAAFSGANLPDLTGGSTLWFFIVKVFAPTRQPELHTACFLILT